MVILIGNMFEPEVKLGDCMTFMKGFPDKFFDVIVTDPPYKYLDHKLDLDFDEVVFFNQVDRILTDNRASNLEWVTKSQNAKHGYDMGLNTKIRPVSRFKDGILVKTYRSAREAEIDGFSNQLIAKCCLGHRISHGNFNWKYV